MSFTTNLKLFLIGLLFINLSIAAQYEITIEKLETLLGEDDKVLKFESLRVKRFNKTTYVVDGSYVLKTPIENTWTLEVDAAYQQSGQWKILGERSLERIGDFVYQESNRNYFEQLQDSSTPKVPWKTIPYPSGNYTIRNYYMDDFDSILPPYLPGGEKWRIRVKYFNEGELIGGYVLFALIRSEKSLLGM